MLVVLQHTGDFLVSADGPRLTGGPLLPGGFLGVDLFFVLSGFLITTLLLEERRETGTIALGRFYERRALRLLPALAVLLAGTTVVGRRHRRRDARPPPRRGWRPPSTCGTGPSPAGVDVGDFGLGHLWSLAVEEQFYLVWPLLLAGLAAATRPSATAPGRLLPRGCRRRGRSSG